MMGRIFITAAALAASAGPALSAEPWIGRWSIDPAGCDRYGDTASTSRNGDGIRNPVEPINQNDDIRGFGRSAGAPGTHGDANVRRGKRRSIIDPITNHERWMQSLLDCDSFNLVGWCPVGENGIKVERCTDCLCRVSAVAGDHHNARDAGQAERLHSPWRLWP